MGGETTNCFLKSFNLMYSSKKSLILSSSKLIVLISGSALIKTGGVSSFGPPYGIPLLAQLTNVKQKTRMKNK